MFIKYIALGFFILGFVVLPVWHYSQTWSYFPMGFCFFVAVLLLLVSIAARRGSSIWGPGGQKPPRS